MSGLEAGRHYVLIRPGDGQHRDRVSVVRMVDQGAYDILWSAAGDVEHAAMVVAAQGWELDGEWLTAPLGMLAALRRSRPGRPSKHGPMVALRLRLPVELHAELAAAAAGSGRSLNDEIVARLRA